MAAISLNTVSLAALPQYEKTVERLTLHWPHAWGLIAQAEDKGRAEKLEKIRGGLVADQLAGRTTPPDWDADETFWSEQVWHPAAAWLASGGKGAPLAPSETIAATHLLGGAEAMETPKEDVEKKRQSNRDRRTAKKKRMQDERGELQKFRSASGGHGHPGGKGSSKGKARRRTRGALRSASAGREKGLAQKYMLAGSAKGR